MHSTLIDADTLATLVEQGKTVVIDCRFSLADTDAGKTAYHNGHIPGAYYAHLEHDLSAPINDGARGRHPLPDPAFFVSRLRAWGTNGDSQVVAYDDAGGAIAARLWWLCQWVGHKRCAVLNAGISAWTEKSLPLSLETPHPQSGQATQKEPLVDLVQSSDLPDSTITLLDARAPERYSGKQEPLDKRAGHIPGALNLPFTGNLNPAGQFLSIPELQNRFTAALDPSDSSIGNRKKIVHYCGSGVTAAHNILAMQYAGLDSGALYAGSWSEWVEDDSRPIASGSSN